MMVGGTDCGYTEEDLELEELHNPPIKDA